MMRLYTFAGQAQAKIAPIQPVAFSSKIKTLLRGDIPLADLPREALRRRKVTNHQRQERESLDVLANTPARLSEPFASQSSAELLTHFRVRSTCFFPADLEQIGKHQLE